jgi:hypothetical protein
MQLRIDALRLTMPRVCCIFCQSIRSHDGKDAWLNLSARNLWTNVHCNFEFNSFRSAGKVRKPRASRGTTAHLVLCNLISTAFAVRGKCGSLVPRGVRASSSSSYLPPSCLPCSLILLLFDMSSIRRRTRSARITSDAFAATKVTLNAIQASAGVFPPLKSAVSAVIVLLELREVSLRIQHVSQAVCSGMICTDRAESQVE